MVLSVDEAKALVTTSLDDADLADVIAREEAWLARHIGPLVGPRSESFITPSGDEVLLLKRPGIISTVADDIGAVADYEQRKWSDVVRTAGTWAGTVVVTYTPDDEDEVKRSLVTVVKLTLTESGYTSESAQGYAAASDYGSRQSMRRAAWRGLLRRRMATSVRLVSTVPAEVRRLGGVKVEAVGS